MAKNKAIYLALGMEEIVAKIVPYKSLFDSTGGGATLSGGEPTLFMIIPRTLLIPGLTDTVDNMRGFYDHDKFGAIKRRFEGRGVKVLES